MRGGNVGVTACWLMVLKPIVLLEHQCWALKIGKGTDVWGEGGR